MSVSVAAEPFPFDFDPDATALVVIDMQRDFLEPDGFGAALGNDVALLRAIVPTVAALLDAARAAGLRVVHTRESHAPDLSDCPPAKRLRGKPIRRIGDPGPMGRLLVRGEPGTEIIPELAPDPGERVLDKPGKGAFHATDLEAWLRVRGVARLLVAGVTTEVCVQTTLREANDRGFDCLLVEDATASYFPDFHRATIKMVRSQGALGGMDRPCQGGALRPEAARRAERGVSAAHPGPSIKGAASRRDASDAPFSVPDLLDGGWRRLPFEPFRDGIDIHRIHGGPGDGELAILRYAPGAGVPRHTHLGTETILVLEGSQGDERGRYGAGTLVVNPPGSSHAVASEEGCVVLIRWAGPIVFASDGQ